MQTFHIHIKGIVQGVGFRPFVYKSAIQHNLKGWINNTNDGVHIELNTDKDTAANFLQFLLDNLPPLARVTDTKLYEVEANNFAAFNIVQSKSDTQPNLLITPDVAMCPDCRRELYDPNNRRYQYPFITCTNCGPRYSIITALPYDRPYTTMNKFKMCTVCLDEYNNPLERRHFSQTNSCSDCAVEMQWYENRQITQKFTDLNKVIDYWKQGKIIAIKGIGGYLLTCDATNENAIKTLRQRKHRPSKAFALMYPDLPEIGKDCFINKVERNELQSIQAPIVLLRLQNEPKSGIILQEINSGLGRLGVMLPYTPLYDLLLHKFKKPIIATSGNITNSPIIYDDVTAIQELSGIADAILMNNRDIVIPQDDGVVQFTTRNKQKIVLRRSRGKTPIYINPEYKIKPSILATGSMLKSVFGFTHQNNYYISQYLGNTESYEAQKNYETTFKHLSSILQPRFDVVVTDKHPGYFSTGFGKKTARKDKIKHLEIQHHKAHFLSVLGENNLLKNTDKILGVIWDGTGLGDDGNIWGGEFFIYQSGHEIQRGGHIGEFDFILADKMVKEPRISALAIMHHLPETEGLLHQKFTQTEWQVYQKLLKSTRLKSTSMGRLFDAIASILYDYDVHTYEAEASMKLEKHASDFLVTHTTESYLKNTQLPDNLVNFIIKNIINDIQNNTKKDEIAAKFHLTLTDYIWKIAENHQIDQIALSGGVFQNALLVDLIINTKPKEKKLYFHKEFSPNDEGIPFGQIIYGNQNYHKD